MKSHAAQQFGGCFAAEVRAEMAAKNLGVHDLASVLGISLPTAKRRQSGDLPFTVIEMATVALWLGIAPGLLIRRAEERLASHEESSVAGRDLAEAVSA